MKLVVCFAQKRKGTNNWRVKVRNTALTRPLKH